MWLLFPSPVTFFKLKFKWNLITTKWCSYTCINNVSARDHSAGTVDIRGLFSPWKSMLSLFGKIQLFSCVNCLDGSGVWNNNVARNWDCAKIKKNHHPQNTKLNNTFLYSLANAKIMSLGLMTLAIFIQNRVSSDRWPYWANKDSPELPTNQAQCVWAERGNTWQWML